MNTRNDEPRTVKHGTLTARGVIPHKQVMWGEYLISAPVAVCGSMKMARPVETRGGLMVYVLPDGTRFEA